MITGASSLLEQLINAFKQREVDLEKSFRKYFVSIVAFQVEEYRIDDFYCTLIVRFCRRLILADGEVVRRPYLFLNVLKMSIFE